MFAFKLWSKFGVFRDPLTITQNMTLPIPPKTAIGGMLAAIIGLDYNEYFNDDEYFSFKYSVVLLNEIRKKSFSQNYVMDYTKKSESKINLLNNVEKNMSKIIGRMAFPKPIYRELLVSPEFLIFIHDYKYKGKILPLLESHQSLYPLYMGNSEFAANFEYITCEEFKENKANLIHSFTTQSDKIKFEPGKKYTKVHSATRVTGAREYRDYKGVVISNKEISYCKSIEVVSIKTKLGDFNCEFI